MKKYDAIIFDLDGTLINTTKGVLRAVLHTIKILELPMLEDSIVHRFVGPPMQDSFSKYYGMDSTKAQKTASIFREYYKENCLYEAEVYDGIFHVLDYLKGKQYKIAVATYKRHDNAVAILEHFGISSYCDYMLGADNENKLSKTDIINRCIESIGICRRNRIVLIGDSEYDAIGAIEAGIQFIGVTYGFGFKTEEDIKRFTSVGVAHNPFEVKQIIDGD